MTEIVTNSSGSILEPVERISEALFASIMVLTFARSFSVAQASREDPGSMVIGTSRSTFRSEDKVRTCIKQLATAAILSPLAAAQTSSGGDDKTTGDSSTAPRSYYSDLAGYVVFHGQLTVHSFT